MLVGETAELVKALLGFPDFEASAAGLLLLREQIWFGAKLAHLNVTP